MTTEFESTMREIKAMARKIMSAKERIKDYLDERASKDELFAKSYAKPNKNIDECYHYIVEEARKQCKDSDSVCISDDVVYGWAVHYYDEDNINVGKSTESTESKELSDADKKKVVEEARNMASNANKKASEAKKKSADAKESKPARIQQLALFDLDEL